MESSMKQFIQTAVGFVIWMVLISLFIDLIWLYFAFWLWILSHWSQVVLVAGFPVLWMILVLLPHRVQNAWEILFSLGKVTTWKKRWLKTLIWKRKLVNKKPWKLAYR